MTSKNDPLGLIGTTIADKYEVESVVGQGGFATVFRAMHKLWKRPVAVKVFTALGDVAPDQRGKLLEDFIQEGALLAELSERSAAICQARDIGQLTSPNGDSVPYMVLEWLDGKPLEDVLEAERQSAKAPRSIEESVRLLDPIAEALALAHSKGIAHRDVKPANIFLLGGDGSAGVKLLDFGIAKVVQDVQKMGFGKTSGHITSFTPLYAAPEQFNRQYGSTGPWTDVFAFALVAAEVMSGKEPMSGETIVQIAYAAANTEQRPTPRTLGVTTSDEVEAIFKKAVAVKPGDRYPNVGAFWNALRTTVIGEALTSMRGMRTSLTGPVPPASGEVPAPPASKPDANAQTAPAPVSATSPASSTAESAAPSRTGLYLGLAIAALVVGGGAVFAIQGGKHPSSAAPTTSAAMGSSSSAGPASAPATSASAAEALAAKACPAGMIKIPGGEYFMGSDEKDAIETEKPLHKVRLEPYCLDEFEETVAQYKECSDRGGCRRAGKENNWPGITDVQKKIYDPLCNIADATAKAQHPINCIDWDQAREACEARGGRLPTEAEWEFAARGPDGRIYPWGDEPPSATLLNACGKECVAWQKKHRDPENTPAAMFDEDDGFPNTAPVGSFPKGKSRYGIQDVVGNVWEWVADYYAEYEKPAPAMSVSPKGPAAGTDRVIRGGAWNGALPAWVRPSFRFYAAPTARSYGFGFRCAKSL